MQAQGLEVGWSQVQRQSLVRDPSSLSEIPVEGEGQGGPGARVASGIPQNILSVDVTVKGRRDTVEETGVYPTVGQLETLQDSPVHESS